MGDTTPVVLTGSAGETEAAYRSAKTFLARINHHEVADAFWSAWKANEDRHGYYEATWIALRAAIRTAADFKSNGSGTTEDLAGRPSVRELEDILNEKGEHAIRLQPDGSIRSEPVDDNWKHRSQHMRCRTCMWYAPKKSGEYTPGAIDPGVGRCRRRAPTMSGFPVMYATDWCGDHKLDENKAPNMAAAMEEA